MKVNRLADVSKYDPPNHFDCTALRLQGWDASDASSFWVGLSHFLPGGGTTHEGTPLEKVYVVVRGEVTVVTDDGEATLLPFDSCHIPAGEARTVVNRTNDVASMIVVMPYPEGAAVTALPRPADVFDLTGRSAVVTGATGAFGEQAAYALTAAGAHVTLAGGNASKLTAVAEAITAGGGRATTVGLRPSTEADVERIVATAVDAGGGLDIVVAGSGTNIPGPIVDQDPADWDTVMDVNVRQSWLLCRAAGKVMIPQGRGGKVILMSSTRGQLGLANYTAYCPSKAAVDLLTKALAVEWGPHRINVNAIAPTVFRSDLTAWMYADEGNGPTVRENMLRRIPLGRLGEPTDFHGAVQLLASSASDFMTGSIVYLDGGYTAG